MIISSGQILTGRAAETIQNGITVAEDTVYYKTIVKENLFNTYSIGTD